MATHPLALDDPVALGIGECSPDSSPTLSPVSAESRPKAMTDSSANSLSAKTASEMREGLAKTSNSFKGLSAMKRVNSREDFLLSMLTEEAGAASPMMSLRRDPSLTDLKRRGSSSSSRSSHASSRSQSPLREQLLRNALTPKTPVFSSQRADSQQNLANSPLGGVTLSNEEEPQGSKDEMERWREQMDKVRVSPFEDDDEEEESIEICDVKGLMQDLLRLPST